MTDILRVRTDLQQMAGNPLVSTMHFDGTTGGASEAASAVASFWSALEPIMSTGCTWEIESEVEVINSSTGALVGVDPIGGGASGAGEATGNPLPLATQGLIRWNTGQINAGRRFYGRTFIPGMTENYNETGVPVPDAITAMAAAATAILSAPDASFVIYGPKHHFFAAVTSGTPWAEWAVLRSRRD